MKTINNLIRRGMSVFMPSIILRTAAEYIRRATGRHSELVSESVVKDDIVRQSFDMLEHDIAQNEGFIKSIGSWFLKLNAVKLIALFIIK